MILFLNVVVLLVVTYTVGFYHAKGRIEIVKRLGKEEREKLKRDAEEQEKEIHEDLKALSSLVRGGEF